MQAFISPLTSTSFYQFNHLLRKYHTVNCQQVELSTNNNYNCNSKTVTIIITSK